MKNKLLVSIIPSGFDVRDFNSYLKVRKGTVADRNQLHAGL